MKNQYKVFLQRGFTFTELIIVIGILSVILGFATINLIKSQSSASVSATVDVLVAGIKEQQMKAMTGDTEGRSTSSAYGIHFDTNQYVLFNGTTYSNTNPSNRVIPLETSLVFENITLSGGTVTFLKLSGEVSGFASGFDSLQIRHTGSQQQKSMQINRYGVITSVN